MAELTIRLDRKDNAWFRKTSIASPFCSLHGFLLIGSILMYLLGQIVTGKS